MKSADRNLDLLRDSDAAKAHACRVAADTERRNPYFTPGEAESRARYYEAQAAMYEAKDPRNHSPLARVRVLETR